MNGDQMKRKQFAEEIDRDLAEGRVLELAELYALDAVTDQERTTIEAHISAAPDALRHTFQQRVCQTREALTIGFATAEIDPPEDLLEKIMARLPGDAAAAPAPDAPRPAHNEAEPDLPQPAVVDLSVRREEREQKARRRSLSTGRRWLVGAAAAALIALGGAAIGSSIISAQDPTHQILNASDVRTKDVTVQGGGTASLAISGTKDAAVVTMHNVPAPPSGKVYQMWLIPKSGGAPVSQGTMDAQALSRSATIKGVDAASTFAITVEPAGGSAAPTLPIVASLTLAS